MPTKYLLVCFVLLVLALDFPEGEEKGSTYAMFDIAAMVVVTLLGFAVRQWGSVFVWRFIELRYILIAGAVALVFFGIPILGVPTPFGGDMTLILGVAGMAIPILLGLAYQFGDECDRRRHLKRQ